MGQAAPPPADRAAKSRKTKKHSIIFSKGKDIIWQLLPRVAGAVAPRRQPRPLA